MPGLLWRGSKGDFPAAGKPKYAIGKIIDKYQVLADAASDEEEEEDSWDEDEFKSMTYQPRTLQSLSELSLDIEVAKAVKSFKRMYEKRDILRNAGLPSCNRILLAGPPGNGKSALAGAIAKEFGLPIYFFDSSKSDVNGLPPIFSRNDVDMVLEPVFTVEMCQIGEIFFIW